VLRDRFSLACLKWHRSSPCSQLFVKRGKPTIIGEENPQGSSSELTTSQVLFHVAALPGPVSPAELCIVGIDMEPLGSELGQECRHMKD